MSLIPLIQLRQERGRRGLKDVQDVGRSFGDGFLTLDKLRVDAEEREREYGLKKGDQALRERQVAEQEAAGVANREHIGASDRRADAKAEADRVKTQEENRRTAAQDIARSKVTSGVLSLEELYKDPEYAGMTDIGQSESPRRELEGAFAEELQNKLGTDQTAYNNQTKRIAAEAARTGANRPRVSTPPKPVYPEDMTGGNISRMASLEHDAKSVRMLISKIDSGEFDPGPISAIGNKIRQAVGLRGKDDVAFMQLNSIINSELNREFGANVPAQEMARAMSGLPAGKDNGLKDLLEAMALDLEGQYANMAKAHDQAAAGAGKPSNFQGAFGVNGAPPPNVAPNPAPSPAPAPKGRKAAPTADSMRPRQRGESRKQYWDYLVSEGLDPQVAWLKAMGRE